MFVNSEKNSPKISDKQLNLTNKISIKNSKKRRLKFKQINTLNLKYF